MVIGSEINSTKLCEFFFYVKRLQYHDRQGRMPHQIYHGELNDILKFYSTVFDAHLLLIHQTELWHNLEISFWIVVLLNMWSCLVTTLYFANMNLLMDKRSLITLKYILLLISLCWKYIIYHSLYHILIKRNRWID